MATVPCNNGNNISTTMAKTPAQRGRWHQRNNGNCASTLRATTPAQQWKQCQCNEGNNTSATEAKTPEQRRWHHCNDSDDTSATKWVTMPVWQWDNASVTTAMMQAQQRQQCQCNKGQWHQCNDGKGVRATMAMAPLQQWQRVQCNNGNGAITTTVKRPEQWYSSSTDCKAWCIVVIIAPLSSLPKPLLPHPSSSKAIIVFLFVVFFAASPTSFIYSWLLCVGVGGCGGVLADWQLPHPPLLLICCPLLPPCVPQPWKVYVILHRLCCLCPPLGGSIVGGIPPPPNAKHNALSSSSHTLSFLLEPMAPCPSSSNSILFLFVVYAVASSTPCLLWLVVVCWADGVRHQ